MKLAVLYIFTMKRLIESLFKLFRRVPHEKKSFADYKDEVSRSIEKFKNRPIYKTLTAEIISSVNDNELGQTIFDSIATNLSPDQDEKEIVKTMTTGQRAIYVTWIVEAEVNNGGFNQFYFNPSGELAAMTEDAFKTIGAIRFAELARMANELYESIKDDLKEYDDGTVERFSESYQDNPLNDLDGKFYELYKDEPLQNMKVKYIRENLGEFISK